MSFKGRDHPLLPLCCSIYGNMVLKCPGSCREVQFLGDGRAMRTKGHSVRDINASRAQGIAIFTLYLSSLMCSLWGRIQMSWATCLTSLVFESCIGAGPVPDTQRVTKWWRQSAQCSVGILPSKVPTELSCHVYLTNHQMYSALLGTVIRMLLPVTIISYHLVILFLVHLSFFGKLYV